MSERYFCSAGSGRQDCDEWETCAFPKRKGVEANKESGKATAEAEMRAKEDWYETLKEQTKSESPLWEKLQKNAEDLENMKQEARARTRQEEAKWQSKREADIEGERKRQQEEDQWSRKTYEEKVREREEYNQSQQQDEINRMWERMNKKSTKSKHSGFNFHDDDPLGGFDYGWDHATSTSKGSASECFSTLGLSSGATKAEVRRAFREKAKTAHPDKGGSNEAFQKIQDAYNNAMLYAD